MFVELTQEFLGKPAGERIDVSDQDARHLIQQGLASAVENDLVTPLVTRALEQSLEERIDRSLQQLVQKHSVRTPKALPFAGLGDAAIDDPRAGFRNFGEFAQAVKDACQPGKRPDDRLGIIAKTAGMGETVGADGGFLVPTEFAQKLLARVYGDQSLLGMTDAYTISSNSITFPRSAETSRANGSRWGGVRAYWRDEGEQGASTKPTFGSLQLTLRKLFVLIHASDELLSDAQGIALEQYLFRVASEEINFVVGDAILNGTGTGQPTGILNSAPLITVAKETGQAAATVVAPNICKMWARLWAPCRRNAVWLINQEVESQLHTMTVGTGASAMAAYLPPGGLSSKPFATLLGRPVLPVEWCPALGTQGDIVLADLRQYVTVSRGMIESAMSIHLRFDYDESTFRFIFRVDGTPWWPGPLTPYKGTATQSSFVTLAERA